MAMPNSNTDPNRSALPRVSIILPVLNAAGILDNCLQSIARQTYPRDRYEILIPDGGSKDGSQAIAQRYGAIVIDDRASRHMEDSKRVALAQASGEYVMFIDADNELTHPQYLERAVLGLQQHPQALGVEAYYPPSPRMSSLCAYLTHHLHISDPLCWLMSVSPVLVAREGDLERWTLPAGTLSYPLGANGFLYRKADLLKVQAGQKFQDTHVAMFLMESGKREWLRLRGMGVHHYYVDTLWSFLLKRRRAMVHFQNVRQEFGTVWLAKKPPMPAWAAALYCLSLVGPAYHAVKGWWKTGDVRWFWHIPASLASVLGTMWGWLTHRRTAHNKRVMTTLQRSMVLSPQTSAPASEVHHGRAAVFLDRDGVINRALQRDGKPYPPTSLSEFEILPDVPAACAQLKAAGFLLVVATNQPDVGRGTLSRDLVEEIHASMSRRLPIDRVEVCYHSGRDTTECACRKPRPGMLTAAAEALGIELRRSWMVGDRWRDIDCGQAAGCRTIFIDYGYEESLRAAPDFRVRSLGEAAAIILAETKKSGAEKPG